MILIILFLEENVLSYACKPFNSSYILNILHPLHIATASNMQRSQENRNSIQSSYVVFIYAHLCPNACLCPASYSLLKVTTYIDE